jgi:hypothetical protein
MKGYKMKGYKGFNKQLQCSPNGEVFQYELGKDYEHTGTTALCRSGFHFCENPLDVLRYYQPCTSRYTEVEGDGVSDQKEGDSKHVASKLHIGAELSLSALIGLGVKFVLEKTNTKPSTGDSSHAATSGNSSPAATSGNSSHAATSGNSSPAATSGYYSHAATSGKESIAASIGRNALAKAALGSWIVLAAYKEDTCEVLTVKTAKVDGKKIKADTFYQLKKGKFVEVKQ